MNFDYFPWWANGPYSPGLGSCAGVTVVPGKLERTWLKLDILLFQEHCKLPCVHVNSLFLFCTTLDFAIISTPMDCKGGWIQGARQVAKGG